MRLNILFRPGVIRLDACPRARHQQNVFHGLCSFLPFIYSACDLRFHPVVGAVPPFSTSLSKILYWPKVTTRCRFKERQNTYGLRINQALGPISQETTRAVDSLSLRKREGYYVAS